MSNLVSRTLGRYRIVARLGRGGMAQVFKAYQPGLKRYVAIKTLHSYLADRKGFISRFEREAAAVARLRHPNIVQVHDFDSEGDLHYMVMEFIEGPTLAAELEERKERGQLFTPIESARILSELASALDYAHSQGMVHRDLKPANIMFTAEGQVVLTDFGIARIFGATRYTATGAIAGTPAYMSPEQGRGERGDARSDIYSLGVTLYEMLTGRLPFEADTPIGIIMKHINEPVPRPTTVNPEVPEAVERVILKAMGKNPNDRYQMTGDMACALREAIGLTDDQTASPGLARIELVTIPLEPAQVFPEIPPEEPFTFTPDRPITRPHVPFQVPADVPHFVGREKELAKFCEVLAHAPDQNIYCLTGMGGIGKTALTIHAAHALRGFFPDGVLWANVATSEPLAILDSWASAFDCDFSGLPDLDSRAAAWRGVLADKKVLVILDDVQSADQVRPLLPGGPQNTVLLTTRDLELGVALNAYEYPLSALTPLESRQLLSRIVGAERVKSEEGVADEICRLLGHLPLAVAIAAQRLASRRRWRLADLAERLRDEKTRLGELKISDREVRASFALSWEALDEELHQVFARLAVFEGRAFRISALAAIAGLDRQTAEDRLYALVSLSLVSEEGRTRYRQHPLLADFARERLGELGQEEDAYARMVHYYRWYAAQNQRNYEVLEREWENLSASMRTAYEREMWPVLITYSQALADAWFARGRYTDARQGYAWACAATQMLQDTHAQAHVLLQWGRACIHQSDYARAKGRLSQSQQLYVQMNDQTGVADVKYELAEIATEQGGFAQAREFLAESLAIRKELPNNKLGVAAILYKLADIEYAQNHPEKAERLGQRALAIREAANDKRGSIQALRQLADIAIALKNYDLAEEYCQRGLTLCEETGEKRELAHTLYSLSGVQFFRHHRLGKKGNLGIARDHAEKGLRLFKLMGDQRSQAQVLWLLSRIDGASEAHDSALAKGQQSLDLCKGLGDLWGEVFLMSHLGDLYLQTNQPAKARDMWQKALNLVSGQEHPLAASLLERLKQMDGNIPGFSSISERLLEVPGT